MALDEGNKVLILSVELYIGFGWVFTEKNITDEVTEVKLKPGYKRTFRYKDKNYIMERWWLVPSCISHGNTTVSLQYETFCYDTEKAIAKQKLIETIKDEHEKIKKFILDTEARLDSNDESLNNPSNYFIK